MVQRKLPRNPDHIMVNSKPLLPSLKPPSLLPQHQDMKMKMKKSGKTSPPLRRPPPPLTPPQKQQQRSSPARASPSSTPNYMKSTSSSDARKELSPHKSSSGSKSGQNPARGSAKATSLRALTKAPSFKPARATKKCSQVVLCEDLEVQRATCSSTLKDSKFPCYLELSPGGTESQGTSAMKVCPYTYCSLNGHHRLPLPPLKCFVSARRRSLKAQRSFKIGCLSPRRAKPPSAGEEESMDFSVEIYCKERAGEDDEIQENRDSAEEGEDIHPASMAAEELRYECSSEEEENHGSVGNQSGSEDSDMEGMEDSALFIDAGVSDEEEEETGCIIDEISGENMLQKSFDEEEEEETGFISDENILQKSFDEESMSSGAWLSDDDDDDTQSSISCPESSSFCVYIEQSPGCNQYNEDENEATQVSDEEICRENQESNDSNDSICSDCVQPICRENQESNVDEELMVEVKMAKASNNSGNQILDLDELPNLRRTGKNKRETEEEEDELRDFNPRGPNFLPLEPDPEAERVSLKHQTTEERKNGEEWMVDYALRQAVSKLAPARRKKVALLVEAFETVSPIPKYESSRSIQACS